MIQGASFAVVYLLHRFTYPEATYGIRWEACLLPLLVLQVGALSLGVGLWLAALTVRYRDLALVSAFVIQLWMYLTPVIYPLSGVPPRWRLVADLNPMTAPVEAFRYVLLGRGVVTPSILLTSAAIAAAALVSGTLAFRRAERTFVDIV
jgi:lipopolysaccharide transport system permease protein